MAIFRCSGRTNSVRSSPVGLHRQLLLGFAPYDWIPQPVARDAHRGSGQLTVITFRRLYAVTTASAYSPGSITIALSLYCSGTSTP
jgi:hypothetical protein